MAYAIKAAIADMRAASFEFDAQKTMYGGKQIAVGDEIFIFASENEGGRGSSRVVSSLRRSRHRASPASSGKRRA